MNRRLLPLFIGGLMGPFGTVVMVPMFPELRETFDATSSTIAWGYTIYLIPFAALLLVSGTLGERWGRRRTVRATYLLYTVASLACALAPNLATFLAGRAVQGVANAFITPLLIAGLAEMVAEERFGRLVGIYSSFQAFGGGIGPIVGGLAADTNWRLAFFGTAAIAALLAIWPPDGQPRADSDAPPIRPLLTARMTALSIAFFAAAAGPIGISILVGVKARDTLGVSGFAAGLILFAGAMTALALGPVWGRALDALGNRTTALIASITVTAASAALAFADGPWTLGLFWALTGGLVGFTVVVFQAIGATVVPGNRGGALSYILAWRFLGHGLGPLVWLAVFENSVRGAFLGAAALGLVTVAVFARW